MGHLAVLTAVALFLSLLLSLSLALALLLSFKLSLVVVLLLVLPLSLPLALALTPFRTCPVIHLPSPQAEAMRRGVELSSPADRLQEEPGPPPARRTVRTPPVTQVAKEKKQMIKL